MANGPNNARKWSTLALLAIVGAALTAATNPGFVARITQKGLDFACQQGVAVLRKDLNAIMVPNLSGRFKIKYLGKGYYSFYSMIVEGFQLPKPQIQLKPNDSLVLSISKANVKIRGRWTARKSFIKASGKFSLAVEDIAISTDLKFGSDLSDHITVASSSCHSHIGKVQVHISGGMVGWLIQLFRKKIESLLRDLMHSKICKIVSKSVDSELQSYIQSLPVVVKVDAVAKIDYRPVAPLTVTEENLEGRLKGEFLWLTHPSPPPFAPPAMDVPATDDRMVYLGISEYFFNTAVLVYQQADTLTMTIKNHMLPKDSKFQLTSGFIGAFVPEVAKKFPSTEVQLLVSLSSPPHLTIHPSGIFFNPVLEAQAFVVFSNSTLTPLFLVGMSTNTSLEVDVVSNRLVGELKMGGLILELKHSDIGPFSVQLLQTTMNFMISTMVLPKINEKLRDGFPLPMPAGVQLGNLIVQCDQHFLLIGADVYRN